MRDFAGQIIGYIEHVDFYAGRARVAGWCLYDSLSVVSGTSQVEIRRYLHRGDVISALGEPAMHNSGNARGLVAFDEEIEWNTGPLFLRLQRGHIVQNWRLPVPSAARMREAQRKLLLPFLGKAWKAVPIGLAYLISGRHKSHRQELVRHFNLHSAPRRTRGFNGEVLSPAAEQSAKASCPITILMPVYNAFELLPKVLERIEHHTDLPWHLILVEDCSSDNRVRPWLRKWAQPRSDRVTLLENDRNLGFIATVNRGLDHARPEGRHVVLFNSDAFVPAGWASRLLQPICDDPKVASVTPMSNDATIFSVPLIARSSEIGAGEVDLIDAVAARLNAGVARAAAPTGVGFCMAMSRAALNRVPQLDTAFGKGYGEEVDWCQRIAKTGMENLGIGTLFVGHRGGQSFGLKTKLAAIEAAGRIISQRYPHYDAGVQDFIRSDPLWSARFVLALAMAANRSGPPLPVYLAHSMGGGADSWLRRRVAEHLDNGREVVVIRVGGAARFHIELNMPDGMIDCDISEPALLQSLFRDIGRLHVVYSCGVGDPDPISLPTLLLELASGPQSSLEVLFHDYLPISPSFNLLDSDAAWRGVPDRETTDRAHQTTTSDGQKIPLQDWQAAWGTLISAAGQLTVFSESSRRIVSQCWRSAAGKIRVSPGRLPHEIPKLAPAIARPGQKVSLAVLGAIGAEKGARIVSELSHALEGLADGPDLVIIGEFDRRFPLAPSTVVTGRYDIRNLASLMRQHRVAAWLMPSVCPETFSFTTHEMIATGLPVISFAIGAQGDAVAAAANGHIVPLDVRAIIDTCFTLLRRETEKQGS